MDALRLEIEALRKEVRADRERIKALEKEAHVRSEKPVNLHQNKQGAEYPPLYSHLHATDQQRNELLQVDPAGPRSNQPLQSYVDRKGNPYAADRKPEVPEPGEYLAEAEAALQRLRQNPRDKQAAEALDRAARRLKAGAKGDEKDNPGNGPPAKQ